MRTLRVFLAGTVTLALLGGLGGAASAQEAEAPEGTSEMLFELVVPRWALPDDLRALEVGAWTMEAGMDATGEPRSSQANEFMRGRAIVVTDGSFLVEPTTEALLWRAPAGTPEIVPAGEPVTLGPGEAIFLAAVPRDEVDRGRYLRVANPGTGDATGLSFHVCEHSGDSLRALASGMRSSGWGGRLFGLMNAPEWIAADEVLFRLTRHRADPGATIESFGYPATAVYLVESGAVQSSTRGPGNELTDNWRAGTQFGTMAVEDLEHALTVVGDEATSVLGLVAIPQSATAG